MQIRKLDTTRKDERKRFVDFAFDLYRDAPLPRTSSLPPKLKPIWTTLKTVRKTG